MTVITRTAPPVPLAPGSLFPGRLAGVTQLIFAALIGGVSALAGGWSPDFVPRWAVLVVLYGLPGVIGLIGVQARRPLLLIAAGLSTAAGSIVAMSGVSLIFFVPALLFLYGAARMGSSSPGIGEGWAGGIAQVGLAAAIVLLVVGAGASAFLNTDAACWTMYRTTTGVRIEVMPFSSEGVQVPDGATSISCSSGLMSARGVGLAGLLGGSALALAAIAARRRGSGSSESRSMDAEPPRQADAPSGTA